MRWFFCAVTWCGVWLVAGCAPHLTYTRIGDANPGADKRVTEQWSESRPTPESSKVRVLLDQVPEGLSIDNGFTVKPGYAHELLGNFKLFLDLVSSSRKNACSTTHVRLPC